MKRRSEPLDALAEAAVEELHSAADLVRWGARQFDEHGLFYGHGTDNAVDEALVLVLHALGWRPGASEEAFEAPLSRPEKQAVVRLLIARIQSRKPAAYLTREAWFAGLPFYVDERVLVPRSPLAEWIDRGFEPFIDPDAVTRVLDLATGSGCIAIACALAFPQAEVDASDLSAQALEVAAINVARHGLESRVRLHQSDVFRQLDGRYDLIVSNPPYVPSASYRTLPEEYRHEPALGLRAGSDGLSIVAEILERAPDHLNTRGLLVVEVGEAGPALERRFSGLPFLWLELAHGGDHVFALTKEQLTELSR